MEMSLLSTQPIESSSPKNTKHGLSVDVWQLVDQKLYPPESKLIRIKMPLGVTEKPSTSEIRRYLDLPECTWSLHEVEPPLLSNIVRMRGLPYDCVIDDVLRFFARNNEHLINSGVGHLIEMSVSNQYGSC